MKDLTIEEIKLGLDKLGVHKSNKILVHSSLSSFGRVSGGALTVIKALLETVGKEETIIVPTLSGNESISAKKPANI